ncbi:hypothetical protein [Microbacterium karelineae]|uniref:hypothetical protein n=1 Tax=Microbacterium karelineae TaxID=2654283 RepID=UPI0012EAFB06|nr:hypothetical protein [Microbacterium karelineae]
MATIGDDWIPHRRASDGELVGWIRPIGDAWQAMSLFAQAVADPADWDVAEDALEDASLAWMAEPWILERGGRAVRVRLVEFRPDAPDGSPGRVTVKTDDFGAIDVPYELIELSWPPPAALRPLTEEDRAAPWR